MLGHMARAIPPKRKHDPQRRGGWCVWGRTGWFLRSRNGVGDDVVVLKLKKRWREVGAAASEQRANRHRLIAVGWRLMAVIGGATAKEQAALAKGRLLRLGV